MNRYTFHITLYDLAWTGIIFTALTLALLLWFTHKANRLANRLLSLAHLIIVLWSATAISMDLGLSVYIHHWDQLSIQLTPALGPLIYFYVHQVIWPDQKLQLKSLVHLSPIVLAIGAYFLVLRADMVKGGNTYNMSAVQHLDLIIQSLAYIAVILYMYKCRRSIAIFQQQQKFIGGDRYRRGWRWLHNLATSFGLVFLLLISFTAVRCIHFKDLFTMDAIYPFYLLLALLLICIATAAILKPVNVLATDTEISKPLLPAELRQKGIWLKRMVKLERYYEDPELNLNSLAEKLGLTMHELSRIINTVLKKSFNDLINEYRVADVIQKMQDPSYDHITLLGIAFGSGFNSQSSFNRIFKHITGKRPLEYKNNLKKEQSNYNMTSYSGSAPVISYHKAIPRWPFERSNRNFMFRNNYLKIAWRNLVRQKLYSFINITGLAIGLAVCMTITLYVAHEHGYDRFHRNADRLVTIRTERMHDGQATAGETVSFATGEMLKLSVPAVEAYTSFFRYFDFLPVVVNRSSMPGVKFSEGKLLFAEPGFFKFFSFKLVSGNASDVLTKPYSVVITQDMAKKYFGDENPIGKTLTIKTESSYTYQVTGIVENTPSNSSIDFNMIASVSTLRNYKGMFPYLGQQQVGPGFFNTYLLLKHPTDAARVAQIMQGMLKKGMPYSGMKFSLPLLTDLHLKANAGDRSNIKYLSIFPFVAILILLLALVNYMSLSTARATLRAKEVGVRKISGASRKTLAAQFYVESAVYSSLSFVVGYLLCCVIKPWFLNALQLKIDNTFFYSPIVLLMLGGLFVATTIIAGSYPSLVLASFKPAISLRGKTGKQTGGVALRKIFTIFQFALSTALIICGIVIDRQMYFFRHADTGIDRENVLIVPIPGYFTNKYRPFKAELRSLPGVAEIGTSNYELFNMHDSYSIQGKNRDGNTELAAQTVDKDLIHTLGIRWKIAPAKGSDLSSPDISKIIINEAAITQLALPEAPVGSYLQSAQGKLQIAGVLKNFNFRSMEFAVQPFGLLVAPDNFIWHEPGCAMYVRVKPHTNLPSLIGAMKNIYERYDKETPFNYSFMDDTFNKQYKAEDRLASMFSAFTIITIVLAAMGLFGLAAFTIEQRTKEIGIRKVMGANVAAIHSLLSKDFLKLVLLSIFIASPIAWWFMKQWLQSFAYRIDIQWWMFAGAGSLAIVIAVITVSYHAIRAAAADPVDSLRAE